MTSNKWLATIFEEECKQEGAHTTTSILWRLLDILEVVVQVNGNMNKRTKLLLRAKE
jgi:hypothetical protein